MKFCPLLVSIVLSIGTSVYAQSKIVISDHRAGSNSRAAQQTTPSLLPGVDDIGIFPRAIGLSKPTDMTQLPFIGVKDFSAAAGHSRVIFGDAVYLDRFINSSFLQDVPEELLIVADTVVITGQVAIDLSKNKQNKNGYLGIICRTLKLAGNAELSIKLAGDNQPLYRHFFVMTEKVLNGNQKVFDEKKVLSAHIKQYQAKNSGILKAFTGNIVAAGIVKKNQQPPVIVKTFASPYQVIDGIGVYDNIANALLPVPELNKFFYQWVVAMHEKVYGEMLKEQLNNKYTFAKNYLKLKALLLYQLPGSYNTRLTAVREKINSLVLETIGQAEVFARPETINGKMYPVISMIDANNINNILLPDVCQVDIINKDTIPRLGYFIYDEKNMNEFSLEFDIRLSNEPAAFKTIESFLAKNNQALRGFTGQVALTGLHLESKNIAEDKSKIIPVSANCYKVHLVSAMGSTLLFYKLFTGVNTDIYIKGEYEHIPFSIPLILTHGLEPVKKNAGGQTGYTTLTLNPDRFGDYFEQIDASDAVTQPLLVYNKISALPQDTISGNLEFVELTLSYNDATRIVKKNIRLSPLNSMGDQASLDILKKGKQFIPITISGAAHYENALYTITSTTINDGQLSFYIKAELLQKQKR